MNKKSKKRSRPISRYDADGQEQYQEQLQEKEQRQQTTRKPKANSAQSLKNKIRSLERSLRRKELKESIRQSHETQLFALKQQLESKAKADNDKMLNRKYHKTKFFERVKLDRKKAQLQKKIQKAEDDQDKINDLQSKIDLVDMKLKYIKFFPCGYKYISILKDDLDEKSAGRREQFMKMALKNSTDPTYKQHKPPTIKKPANKKRKTEPVDQDADAEEEEVDDFFQLDGSTE